MNKNILKNTKDFQLVLSKRKLINNESFSIFYKKNNLNHLRYGIAVGKKTFKLAVQRNKIKRWVRIILVENINLNVNFDIVIKVNSLKKNKYLIFKTKLINLIDKINKMEGS